MKKTIYIVGIIIVMLVIGMIVVNIINNNKDNQEVQNNENDIIDEDINIESRPKEEEILNKEIEDKINSMTLREKIGQMLIISTEKTEYDEELDALLKEVKPSGVVLFSYNVTIYDKTVELISKMKDSATIPMLIGIDQEGGRVQRIKNIPDVNVINIPEMLELGKTKDKELAYDVGRVVAKEIAAFGINLDFAPVLDIFSNPNNTVIGNRAFGTDAQTVIDMALSFANGMENEGIIPVYKHFPGHGDTDSDSHVELPVITKTKEELLEKELLPFKEAIENDAQMIMTAHIALPSITGDYTPATLSKTIINDLLREELGFKGVVSTDAVNMKAIADNYTIEEVCRYSINAGVDIILMPEDPKATIDTIEKLVTNGTITEDRIDESVKRILTLKYKNKLDEPKELNKENIGTQESIDIINKINTASGE
ncbi:MAG: beta-N-acetylhexosaminidase [Clostridia bacterium]|nr:beta-N-acetylhexosaminidase [Clostridia bacterium]